MTENDAQMTVFYFQHEGKTHIVCTSDLYPSRLSQIWNCNTSVFLVPGSEEKDDEVLWPQVNADG